MTSQNKTPVISRELRILFSVLTKLCQNFTCCPWKMKFHDKHPQTISQILPSSYLLHIQSHYPFTFIFPLLYVLITLKPRDNSKKLKTLLQSQLSLLLSHYFTPNSKVLDISRQNQFSSASVHVQILPHAPALLLLSKFESSKLIEIQAELRITLIISFHTTLYVPLRAPFCCILCVCVSVCDGVLFCK